jgi:peptidoglycan DL-endopeptidase CwlO
VASFHGPARRIRRLVTLATGALAALAVGVLPATQAHATPSPQQVEAQIDQVWGTLEPLIEQYNGVHYQLTQNQAKQAALIKQMGPLQIQVDLAQTRVGAMSADLYMHGPGSNINALLESGSPADLIDRLNSLNELARQQQETVAQAQQQVNQYAAQKKALDLLVAQQQQQDADLTVKKNTIQTQLNQLQQLRTAAYGASGSAGGSLKPVNCPVTYIGGAGGKAAQVACSLIGHPYGFAQAGPTYYDCSGLTMAAWAAAGVSLAHFTVTQHSQTRRISAADLQPGDLVFYGSDLHHVALYVGGGWVVHAPTPGDYVRMAKMADPGTINSYGRPG